jgi:hypothetical protein
MRTTFPKQRRSRDFGCHEMFQNFFWELSVKSLKKWIVSFSQRKLSGTKLEARFRSSESKLSNSVSRSVARNKKNELQFSLCLRILCWKLGKTFTLPWFCFLFVGKVSIIKNQTFLRLGIISNPLNFLKKLS